MGSKIDLGGHVIIFSDSGHYQQCISQIPISVTKVRPKLYFYNTDINPIPSGYAVKSKQFYYIPYNQYSGIVSHQWNTDNVLRALSIMNPNVPYIRISNFGYSTPEVAPLAQYGKNFPNGKGMDIPNSWEQNTKDVWGKDTTASATVGNTFGPGNNGQALTAKEFHQPRMSIPGGPLDAFQMLNARCNQAKSNDPMLHPGTFPESTNFGKRRRTGRKARFGNLYTQMGPAYGGSNQITPYGGGKTVDSETPGFGSGTWVGSAKPYNPLARKIINN
jgi:hypothetical protein